MFTIKMHTPLRGTLSRLIIALCTGAVFASFGMDRLLANEYPPACPRETDTQSLRHSKLDPSRPDEIIRIAVNGNAKPDILERWWKGKRVRFFDEKGTMTWNCVWGDMVNGSMQVDMDGDGFYDGPGDYHIKWADTSGNAIPDVELFNSNPNADSPSVIWQRGVFYMTIDPASTGVMMDLDWRSMKPEWVRWDTPSNWRTNYQNSTFIKEHTPIWAIDTPEYSWENPFHFWDPDGDGCPEVSLRVIDHRIHTTPDRDRIKFDGVAEEAFVSYNLDNSTGRGNEASYDFTLYVDGGRGVDYSKDIHEFPQLRAPDWMRPYFRYFDWRQQTRFRFLGKEDAISRAFSADWGRAIFTFDEDGDCYRWERVEILYPGDPYLLKRYSKDSPIYHPQSDSLGDRGEWDLTFRGKGKLYRAPWDGKIHLMGTDKGAWTVDHGAKFNGAIHPNGKSSKATATKVGEVILYADKDGDGYIDWVSYDYNGDGTPNRVDDLNALGVEVKGRILDVTTMSWEAFRKENAETVASTWQQAQRMFLAALSAGYVDDDILKFSKAASIGEKYIKAYWLKEKIVRKILEKLPAEKHADLLKSYYNNDIGAFQQILEAYPSAKEAE